MAQTYDNACDDCGQDRDSERKLRAMKTAFMNVADLWTDTLVRAERAEWVLASQQECKVLRAECEALREEIVSKERTIRLLYGMFNDEQKVQCREMLGVSPLGKQE